MDSCVIHFGNLRMWVQWNMQYSGYWKLTIIKLNSSKSTINVLWINIALNVDRSLRLKLGTYVSFSCRYEACITTAKHIIMILSCHVYTNWCHCNKQKSGGRVNLYVEAPSVKRSTQFLTIVRSLISCIHKGVKPGRLNPPWLNIQLIFYGPIKYCTMEVTSVQSVQHHWYNIICLCEDLFCTEDTFLMYGLERAHYLDDKFCNYI